MGKDVLWLFTDEISFNTLKYSDINTQNYSENSDERLDWYDYNFSVHRIEAKERVYVIDDGSTKYKVQFLSYYDADDKQRQISLIVSWIDGEPFQALNDPEKIQPSQCILIDTDLNENRWNSNETIYVKENDFQICASSCELSVQIYYQGIRVDGSTEILVNWYCFRVYYSAINCLNQLSQYHGDIIMISLLMTSRSEVHASTTGNNNTNGSKPRTSISRSQFKVIERFFGFRASSTS